MHLKAVVEYDGTDFFGFQRQHHARTVQGVLEEAIVKRFGHLPRHFACAGRTDSGVHALGQVITFDAEPPMPIDRVAIALNSTLPPDVRVRRAAEAEPTFHARFSASSRVYLYLILNREASSPILRRYSAFCPRPLDIEAMGCAANYLLGEHDFTSFANDLLPGETTARELISCHLRKRGDIITVRMEANAFLRGMVRTIVGTLLEVGTGKRSPESMLSLLTARDRRLAGPTAPPQGLFLLHVRYGHRKQYSSALRSASEEMGI